MTDPAGRLWSRMCNVGRGEVSKGHREPSGPPGSGWFGENARVGEDLTRRRRGDTINCAHSVWRKGRRELTTESCGRQDENAETISENVGDWGTPRLHQFGRERECSATTSPHTERRALVTVRNVKKKIEKRTRREKTDGRGDSGDS